MNFDDLGDADVFDEPFSLDEDVMNEDFDLPDLDELGDDLISPEEENELISMSEDSWSPHDDDDEDSIQPLDDDELENSLFLDHEDIEAAHDFMPGHDLDDSPVGELKDSVSDAAMSLVEKQTELLSKIEKEISVIRDEILDIRNR